MRHVIASVALIGMMILLIACSGIAAARPSEEGEIVIVQEDYKFVPDTIRVKAGQEVTIVLVNRGAKEHELMIGRNTHVEDGITEPFLQDFFEGIMLEVSGAGTAMGGPMEEMAGMEHDEEEHDMEEEAMLMPLDTMEADGLTVELRAPSPLPVNQDTPLELHLSDMDGNSITGAEIDLGLEMMTVALPENKPAVTEVGDGVYQATANFILEGMWRLSLDVQGDSQAWQVEFSEIEVGGGMAGMEEHAEEGGEHSMGLVVGSYGALQRGLMDVHAGFMVMHNRALVTPSDQVTTITFTVPEDKVGEWELGCFQEQGLHYDDGMRGTLIVDPP